LGGLDLSSLLGSLNPGAPSVSSSSAPAVGSSAPAGGRLTAAHLQQALAGSAQAPTQPPRLEEILTTDAIMNSGVLNDPDVRREMVGQLPEGQQSDDQLEANIRSAQFQQSLGALSDALLSDGGSGVTASFGINPAPGMSDLIRGDPVGAFLSSVQAANPAEISSQSSTAATAEPNNEASKEDDSNNMEE
jgi:hypothetical protein